MTGDDVVAITGVGVLTPLGDRLAAVTAAVMARQCALTPATEPTLAGTAESRIFDFDATRYANVRGMRIYNRTTRLGIAAATLALADAKLDGDGDVASEDLGLVMASTFGHLDTVMDYDQSLVTAGLQRTNPALMPLGLPSSPGAAVALSLGVKAFSITMANDAISSLDALAWGARLVSAGRARVCVVVGAFAPFVALSLAALRAGLLDRRAGQEGVHIFDRRHAGAALGEAGIAMVLERSADAIRRGAAAHGIVAGHGATFGDPARREISLRRACEGALRAARIAPADLALVSAGGNGVPESDRAEALALGQVLGSAAATTPVIAPKANLGEPLDAGGLWQAVIALGALRTGQAPPIFGLDEPAVSGLHYPREASNIHGTHALVTALSSTGSATALILAQYAGGTDMTPRPHHDW